MEVVCQEVLMIVKQCDRVLLLDAQDDPSATTDAFSVIVRLDTDCAQLVQRPFGRASASNAGGGSGYVSQACRLEGEHPCVASAAGRQDSLGRGAPHESFSGLSDN